VSIPIYGDVPPEFLPGLMNIIQAFKPDELCVRTYTRDGLISRVRNRMFSDFINGQATHLITFDDDCIFTLQDFNNLVSWKDSSKDIVVGAVPTKSDNPYFVYRLKKPVNEEPPLIELDVVGDFMIVSRDAAERVVRKHNKLLYKENKGGERRWAVFQPMVYAGEYLDETWSFSKRVSEAGCRMWLDTRIVLGHAGTKVFYKR
jgi:hypothetical protein